MKIRLLVLCSFLALPFAAARGADAPVKPPVLQSGESSVQAYRDKQGCGITKASNTRFTAVAVHGYANHGPLNLILRETLKQDDSDCSESVDGKLSVEAMSYDKDFKNGTKLWSFSSVGWEGASVPDGHETLYKVSMPGCCGSSDTDTYFSMWNGKRLFLGTGPLLTLAIPNSDGIERFVSLLDNGSTAFKDTVGASDAVAVLYFGTDQGPPESVVVHRSGDNVYHYSDLVFVEDSQEQSDRNLELWKADKSNDPKMLTGVTIRGKLECECDTDDLLFVDVPVVNGHLDLKDAKSNDPAVSFTLGSAGQ